MVLLDVDPTKRDGFCRLIKAGLGDVIIAESNLKPSDLEVPSYFNFEPLLLLSFNTSQKISLVVIDAVKGRNSITSDVLSACKCPMVSPEYIAEYLTSDPPPLVELYRVPIKTSRRNPEPAKKRLGV